MKIAGISIIVFGLAVGLSAWLTDAVVVSPPRQVFTATWVRLRCQ
jgi:hypothetical protein